MKYILTDIEKTIWDGYFWPGVFETYNKNLNTEIKAEEWDQVISTYSANKSGGRDIVLNYYAEKTQGKNTNDLTQSSFEYIREHSNLFFDYVIPFFQKANQFNYEIYFATAGPNYFAEGFKKYFDSINIKITDYLCSEFYTDKEDRISKNDRGEFIKIFPEKDVLAHKLLEQLPEKIICMGDHKDDVAMMDPISKYKGFPICINPSSQLRDIAINEKWMIYETSENPLKIIDILEA